MTTAKQARNEAMAQADAGADPTWKDCVELVIEVICHELGAGKTFTTDLVWARMEREFPGFSTHEPRAMGPMMTRVAARGLIEKTDLPPIESERTECHARPLTVWKVLP